ncbi:nucleotidyltransferase domain-containing protein [Anabaena cylindrica FACHB-243]|uniref:Nucleotidyltransferase n=1 Tax=Anabaena cylindrica (strain ATCC 27899 / PCC 7122) TaxID=272123 RepID=K9ZDQ4_ANACC|nr:MULTISPECIES: nucleotidyltransferase domain-containing protein [Anabaena]AFZ57311.1 Nucleotidyltransferase [Anabaena cylindrica PCC 7122]MBD2420979.1 nucleotidyltransferase domain-containing protein [Anabaena cylindrica FACHB-243]MBY5284737.1 nucleotidyltransferase [Anabaena sp. CCAP 1446/1C]MBY5308347.1 nucleotidyltransferase [Anabaena sp. CCAP 1446/1C]MCM2405732.1 nucleotidyltransferase domain-containing protein [Anabaena sp. CCAP 1446/1C]
MKRIEVEQRTIFVGLAGSHGYGLNRPDSDYDYRGVFIAPKRYYLGFDSIEQKDTGWDEPGIFPFIDGNQDTVIYELRKVLHLLAGANPNVLELLWLPTYPMITKIGEYLIKNRQIFLSKKVKHTYSGYAFAQIKKMETHRKWLLNPPAKKPIPSDFGIEDETPLSKDELNAFLEYLYILIKGKIEFLEESEQLYKLLTADVDFKGLLKQYTLTDAALEYTQNLTNSRKDFIRLLQKSQSYQIALREWKAYLSWQENRNPARAEMEKNSGYDLKHGMHCIRLLRSGLEILQQGEVIVDRKIAGDVDDLKAILRGDYTYDQLMKMAENLVAQMDIFYEQSTLPHKPDLEQINSLCMELVEMQGWQ